LMQPGLVQVVNVFQSLRAGEGAQRT